MQDDSHDGLMILIQVGLQCIFLIDDRKIAA